MGSTRLDECARCRVLVHAPAGEPYGCPKCGGALSQGLVDVGFHDARRVYGEPGEPWRPPQTGTVLRCADGHKARSRDEVLIDDWLHAHGVPHEREPKLKGMRPDWRVGSVYVEYWGMAGQQGYEDRRAEKLALYRKRKLRLVELFPEDVGRLHEKLGFLVEEARRLVARRGLLEG